jgi:glutathione synthase/RimK-type ligase-like ATP-grasp enzyme
MSILAILSFVVNFSSLPMILFISPKTVYFTRRLKQEAQSRGVVLDALDVNDLAKLNFEIDVSKYQALYARFCYPYFEQIIELAQKFIGAGKKVVDAAIAEGNLGLGKMADYEKLSRADIPVPKTEKFLQAAQWQYPCIVKWDYGFGGKEVCLVKNPADLHRATEFLPPEELLLQEFIPAEYEYKVVTVGYKSLPVVLRFAVDQNNWRPDFGKTDVIYAPTTPSRQGRDTPPRQGGEAPRSSAISGQVRSLSSLSEEESPPQAGEVVGADKVQKIVQIAEQSSRLLKRELAKVDILESNGKFYVLEVNRCPGLKSFEELTGYNAVADFLKYLTRFGQRFD